MKRDADSILAGLKSLETPGGKLRVFIGMCPGVGKTFSMLRAAREMKARGVEIVVGVVETHGRPETEALLEGLEILPRRKIQYRDTEITEFDLDAALARKPQAILVDELAHTNVPGSRHPKRYQDVEELLAAGIDVLTTVNVQHIESRADLVEQMTGVSIRERVPDSLLDRANPIELIDLSPEQLLKRLDEGNVYQGDRAVRARDGFFKEEHLIALREISLRLTADLVDDRLLKTMSARGIVGPWNTGEKLLVAVSHSPYSARLIRACRRTAATLGAPWIALHVRDGETLTDEDETQLKQNLNLARDLGAEILATTDSDVASAIQRAAAEQNVTQIVMGRPDRRLFRDLFTRGTLLDRLVVETSNIDIHVIRQVRRPKFMGFGAWLSRLLMLRARFGSGALAYWQTLWLMVGVGGVSFGFADWIGYRAVGYIFLLTVLLVASVATLGPIIFAAALGVLSWNFFFIPPRFTFQIGNKEDLLLTAVYFVVAVVGGTLSHRVRRQREEILSREVNTRALFEMTRHLAETHQEIEMGNSALDVILTTFHQEGTLLAVTRGAKGEPILGDSLCGRRSLVTPKTQALADWVARNGKAAGDGTQTLSATGAFAAPVKGPSGILAVLLLPRQPESLDSQVLLDNLLQQLGISLERARLSELNESMRLAEHSERLYQTVLNSVSHELKTPLTTLVGAAGTLVASPKFKDAEEFRPLVEDITDASMRMRRVVDNLLDVSRLSRDSGLAQLNFQLLDWSDHVTQTLSLLKRDLRLHQVEFQISPEDLVVSIDERLMEHAIINLVSNAINYAPIGTTIQIATKSENGNACLSIRDEGPGIPAEYREKIFEKFFRLPGSKSGGTGLGLTLVRQIVREHHGSVELKSETDLQGMHGSEFIVRIPLREAL